MLDRGEQLGWFDSNEIIAEAVVFAAGFYFFLAHSLTTMSPFVRLELFRDRNFFATPVRQTDVLYFVIRFLAFNCRCFHFYPKSSLLPFLARPLYRCVPN